MRPLIQPWYIAITQVAPPDLENLYLCAVISGDLPDVPLCTAADISSDEIISIYGGGGSGVVQRLGFDIYYFMNDHVLFKTFRNNRVMDSNYASLLIPTEAIHWFPINISSWDIRRFVPIVNRLDAGEYLWIRKNRGNLSVKGFLRSH
jgi:hypothetical protein